MADRLTRLTSGLTELQDQLRRRGAGAAVPAPVADSAASDDPQLNSCLLASHLLTSHALDLMPRSVADSVVAVESLLCEIRRSPSMLSEERVSLLGGMKSYLESLLARCDDVASGRPGGRFGDLDDAPEVEGLAVICRHLAAPRDGVAEAVPQAGAQGLSLLLMLSSASRRAVLGERLRALGFRVEVLGEVVEVWRRCRCLPRPAAILCDHLAPTRHLQRLAGSRSWHQGDDLPALILVAPGRPVAVRRQARLLRAAGAWTVPYAVVDLIEILAELRSGPSPDYS